MVSRCSLGALLAVATFVVGAAPAHAAFPGTNGKIAFYTSSGPDDDVYVMQPDGSGRIAITGAGNDERDPAWSPDGTKIAFEMGGEITVMNADGSGVVNLTNYAGADADPTWSPDGSKIAFVTARSGDVGSKIYVMDADDGGNLTRLTDGFGITDNSPAWSPDGRYIAFYRVNQSQLFRMNADGTGVTQITSGPGSVGNDPNWSPSGHRIAYTRFTSSPATTGIHTMDPDGTNDVDLSGALTEAHDPAWSPDGTKLVVGRNGHVWTMNANGSSPTQLTTVFGTNGAPDWQPAPYTGYPRPKGAGPLRVSLVPAFNQCTSPDRVHGPPLAFGSCSSPSQVSPYLMVGTPDANGVAANSVGHFVIHVVAGAPGPPDDSGAPIEVRITDVRCNAGASPCGPPNSIVIGDDYAGELQLDLQLQMTDKWNAVAPGGGFDSATGSVAFPVTFGCAATASTGIGALCSIVTDANAVVPGSVKDTKRAIWAMEQVRVLDGGPDGDADTPGNSVFAVQGLFVP